MAQSFSFACLLGVLMGLSSCAGRPEQPVKPPPAETETRFERRPNRQTEPKILAPPPAYGNKIVMARAKSATVH